MNTHHNTEIGFIFGSNANYMRHTWRKYSNKVKHPKLVNPWNPVLLSIKKQCTGQQTALIALNIALSNEST